MVRLSVTMGSAVGWTLVLVASSGLLGAECVKVEAATPVGSVRSETVAVKVGGDVIRLSSAALLRRPGLLWTSGTSVPSSFKSVAF